MASETPRHSPTFSFVIPVYNEAPVLSELYERLNGETSKLKGTSELIFIDDGSTDASGSILLRLADRDRRVRVIELSRNYGQAIAITAGIDFASGDAVIVMDADLQDPPALVHDLVSMWRDGYEVVSARRVTRDGEGFWKRASAGVFYRLLRRVSDVPMPEDIGEFRLIDRRVAEVLREMRERHRYVRGLIMWSGFRQTTVPFERPPRAAGQTKYTLRKMLRLAWDGMSSFSQFPLKMIIVLGMIMGLLAFAYALFIIAAYFLMPGLQPGWSTIVVLITFLSGVQLITIGVVGLYVGKIFEEVKGRPLYIVRSMTGVVPVPAESAAGVYLAV